MDDQEVKFSEVGETIASEINLILLRMWFRILINDRMMSINRRSEQQFWKSHTQNMGRWDRSAELYLRFLFLKQSRHTITND